MTLDEAIKTEENIAEENQRVVDTGIVFDDVTLDVLYCDDTEVIEEHLANYQRCAEKHRQIAEWLKELKQLKKQTKWIPVSERLPENSGNYLITYCYEGKIETQEAVYVIGEEDKWFDTTDIEITLAVIAWMPLPKSYKESE